MSEELDIHTKRLTTEGGSQSELKEKALIADKGTYSTHISQISTQEVSHKSSFDDLSDLASSSLSAEVLFSELAFPTGKVNQKVCRSFPQAKSPLYESLSVASQGAVHKNVADLKSVLETLETDLMPVDLRATVSGRKSAVLLELPKTSTLLRARKTR